jgi:transposase
MRLVDVTDDDRRALEEALGTTRRVRAWRRLQAVRLLADGREAPEVAQVLGCSASSVYYWAADWRAAGLAGLAEGPHPGRPQRLDGAAQATLEQVLTDDPQAHGYAATDWTVPLLRTELAQRGHALSARTLRRTLHRLGYRWKRPKYVLGRPDPAYAAKKGRWSSK